MAPMGLYDVVLGDGKQAERGALLLGLLGNPEVARFRDAWAERGEDGPVIAVYTRTGGPNRADYKAVNDALAAHPDCICDADDDFDPTYCTFRFRVPEGTDPRIVNALAATAVEPVNMSERWKDAIARVGRGELKPSETAMLDQFASMLADESPDAPRIMEV
jgi:hypothetical protein